MMPRQHVALPRHRVGETRAGGARGCAGRGGRGAAGRRRGGRNAHLNRAPKQSPIGDAAVGGGRGRGEWRVRPAGVCEPATSRDLATTATPRFRAAEHRGRVRLDVYHPERILRASETRECGGAEARIVCEASIVCETALFASVPRVQPHLGHITVCPLS